MNGDENGARPLWRQPLVHFLVAGAAIFALNEVRGPAESAGNQKIVVTVAAVERMAGLWQKTWGRPPSEAELQALVRDHIKEEIYYREALKLGLDINDTVIRRRLRQKMEFMTSDEAIEPDEADLQTFYEQNAEKYRKSPVFDFEQVYFSGGNDDRIARALAALHSEADPEGLGEPIDLPSAMSRADEAAIARTFGSQFYAGLQALEPGVWSGPVMSGFGQHLVRIGRKDAARQYTLEETRKTVENDWRAEQQRVSLDEAFRALRKGYEIEIETPE